MKYLLDTDTLIFLIRGLKIDRPRNDTERERQKKAEKILNHCQRHTASGHTIALSAISAAELEHGAQRSGRYEQERQAIEKILTPFLLLDFDSRECARCYGEVRHELESAGVPIGSMDLLIAAHAKAADATLITNNSEDFKRINGLRLENWT